MAIDLLTRAEKGSALTIAEHDTNLSDMQTAINDILTPSTATPAQGEGLLGIMAAGLRKAAVGSWIDEWTGGATGAVYRALKAKLGGLLDLKDFGAVGDGTTDDSAAVIAYMAHIDASAAYNTAAPWVDNQFNRHARNVFRIPPGTYRVVSRLAFDTSAWTNVTHSLVFEGQGQQLSRILFDPVEPNTASGTIGTVTNAHQVTLAVGSSAVDQFYKDCKIFFSTGDTLSLVATILDYVGSTRVAKLSVDINPLPVSGTTTYTIKGVPYVGTANAGTISSITLASGDANVALFNANTPVGMRMTITAGGAAGAEGLIVGWNSGTRVLTMGRTFMVAGVETAATATSVYRIQGHAMIRNERAVAVRFQRCSFVTAASKSMFYWSDRKAGYAIGGNAAIDCYWHGFSRVFEMRNTANDNNDTSYFIGCSSLYVEEDFIRLIDSDQELHWAFYNHFHHGCRGPLINADKGGAIYVYGLDLSAWGYNAVNPCYAFELDASPAANGVMNFSWVGGRSEVFSNNGTARIMKCLWTRGTVNVQSVDMDSMAATYAYNYPMWYFNTGNSPGPQTTWRNCKMVGKIQIEFASVADKPEGLFHVQDCGWYDLTSGFLPVTPEEVVTYTYTSSHANRGMAPAVWFDNCRRDGATRFTAFERYVWDYVVGWRTQRYGFMQRKTISIPGAASGLITTGNDYTIYLPIGAVIEAFRIWFPTSAKGGSAQTTTAAYELRTVSGLLIATVTISNPSLGGDQRVAITGGWDCDTDARRQVRIVALANATTFNVGAVPMIEYLG